MSELTFHPLANLFPMLDGVAFERFVEDIRANGQLQPIIVHEGQILDGRNRYRACLKLQIVPKTIPWDGKGSLLSTVLSLNLHRRHLTGGQKAALAAEIEPLFVEECRARQLAGVKQHGGNGAQSAQSGHARELAGRVLSVSGRYVQQAKFLLRESPELFQQVKAGQVELSAAMRAYRKEHSNRHGTQVTATDLRTGISRTVTLHDITADGVINLLKGAHAS